MPTNISLAAGAAPLEVSEDAETVRDAFNAAGGNAIELTRDFDGHPLFVNPAQITHWSPVMKRG